jgi:hypothetical protein
MLLGVLPALQTLAEKQYGVFRRSQALACGYPRAVMDELLRSGTWVSVSRGCYATAETWAARESSPGRTYFLTCAARLLSTRPESVISHESAAVLLGVPLLDPVAGAVRVTVPAGASSTRGGQVGRYVAHLPAAHRTTFDGLPVTSAARTVVDLARGCTLDAAMAAADGALRLGLDRARLLDVLAACRRWPGVEQAQQVVMMATRWSESPLESLAMQWFRRQRLPLPEQQLTVRTEAGRWLARVDFVWREHRTVCEVDGRTKYVAETGAPAAELTRRSRALWEEKLREDRLRDTGLEVVRGYWSDRADDGAALADRLRRAFTRGAAAALPGTYRISDERVHARTGPWPA